jgi:hypothetical protein
MKYERVNGFHYIKKGKDWYVMIEHKWYKCAEPKPYIKLPLLLENAIQKKEDPSTKGDQ